MVSSGAQFLILFNLFDNKISENIKPSLIEFVDDTKIGEVINNQEDRLLIQNDLDLDSSGSQADQNSTYN